MAFKFIPLMLVMTACIALQTQAAATKKSNERVADVYVKDGNNGELRFLGAAQIDRHITNKINLLEQLRPNLGTGTGGTGTGGTGTGGAGIGDIGTTLTPTLETDGILTSVPTDTGLGVGPLYDAIGASPVAELLPQIIAQAATQGSGNLNRRRVPNRRRVNRRRPVRRGIKRNRNKIGQIYVIRPRA